MSKNCEIITFGCRLNSYESELIKVAVNEAGVENVTVFNSCAVTAEAERQLRQAIRKTRRENPKTKIVLTGCAAQTNHELYSKMPEIDQIIGNDLKTSSSAYANTNTTRVLVNDIMSIKETAHQFVMTNMDGRARAFLQVQNGCNHRCTYCIIPYGRGNSRSVPLGEILEHAQSLVKSGYNELVLTGVDITDYGKDLPGEPTLGMTIKRLLKQIPELPRLRLSSIDVAEIDHHLMDLIKSEERLMPHLHLSLQSGDNMILKRMKRRHTREEIIDFCTNVTTARPGIVIGADIITGFPTENDEMFQNTYDIVRQCNIIHLHAFPYSERPGTPAAKMPKVDHAVRKHRARILKALSEELLRSFQSKIVGQTRNIVIESDGFGRTEDYILVKGDNLTNIGSIAQVRLLNSFEKGAMLCEHI